MRRVGLLFNRFISKFTFEVIPAVLAGLIAAATLAYFHLGRPAEQMLAPTPANVVARSGEEPSIQSQRDLTRQVLKARRENTEVPAQVIPRPERGAIAAIASAPAEPAATPVGEPRPRPKDIANRATAPAAPGSAPAASADSAPSGKPLVIGEPIVVTAPREEEMRAEPAPGPVGAVFSAVSVLTGKAVNATGDTLSWVVELPGRIVSTGGKLLEKAAPQPPPRREAL